MGGGPQESLDALEKRQITCRAENRTTIPRLSSLRPVTTAIEITQLGVEIRYPKKVDFSCISCLTVDEFILKCPSFSAAAPGITKPIVSAAIIANLCDHSVVPGDNEGNMAGLSRHLLLLVRFSSFFLYTTLPINIIISLWVEWYANR